jgi:hypothetical protein
MLFMAILWRLSIAMGMAGLGQPSFSAWDESGVIYLDHQNSRRGEAILKEMITLANSTNPLHVSAWKIDEPSLIDALETMSHNTSVAIVLNTWDLDAVARARPHCKRYLASGHTAKMLRIKNSTERLMKLFPGAVRFFQANQSCAFHGKLWIVRDIAAALLTFNSGKNESAVNVGVLIRDRNILDGLQRLHDWDFARNTEQSQFSGAQMLSIEHNETDKGDIIGHPAIFAGWQADKALPDIRNAYQKLFAYADSKITLVSPSFSSWQVADWLSSAMGRGVTADIMTTADYWGVDGEYNLDQRQILSNLTARFPRNIRVINFQELRMHAKLILFHGRLKVPHEMNDTRDQWMRNCECPFLFTSANLYPCSFESRELGVLLCSCAQWRTIHERLWRSRLDVVEGLWRSHVKAMANISQIPGVSTSSLEKILGHPRLESLRSQSLAIDDLDTMLWHICDLDGNGQITRDEFTTVWKGTPMCIMSNSECLTPPGRISPTALEPQTLGWRPSDFLRVRLPK